MQGCTLGVVIDVDAGGRGGPLVIRLRRSGWCPGRRFLCCDAGAPWRPVLVDEVIDCLIQACAGRVVCEDAVDHGSADAVLFGKSTTRPFFPVFLGSDL